MTGGDTHDEDPIRPPLASAATLVVRTWLDPRSDGPPRLRGTVSELGGRMLGAFDTLERLAALVEAHTAGGPLPSILTTSEKDDDRE